MIWGETGRPGYGLYDRALGCKLHYWYLGNPWEIKIRKIREKVTMKLPFEIDLKDKVVVITGAGGVPL